MFKQHFMRIRLKADHQTLNPLLEPNVKAQLSVFGITAAGDEIVIPHALIKYNVSTILTCGDADVATVDSNGMVTPLNGGYVKIEATYVGVGLGLSDSIKIVIRPFYHDYHTTLTYKLFMAMEPYGSLWKENDGKRDSSVYINIEEAFAIIRDLDVVTGGIPKIVYLVGGQNGGHDHGYPDIHTPNPRLKRDCDMDAAASIRWLMREARKYHTTVSLHVNLVDAWEDSPLWKEYHEKHILVENPDGTVANAGGGFSVFPEKYGINVGLVSQRRLWDTGEFQKRFAELLDVFPELIDAHTIHIDNWRAVSFPTMGISKQDDEEAIRLMYIYLRQIGLDATSEGSSYGRNEPMTGLQPMTWWDIPYHPSIIPPCLYCGGRAGRLESDPRFGDSIHVESTVKVNLQRGLPTLNGLQDEFCLYTLPWHFLNSFQLEQFDGNNAVYSHNVKAFMENGVPVILWNKTRIRYGSTVFVPLLWSKKQQIMLYSFRDTYYITSMPETWQDVKSVDMYYIDPLGREQPYLEICDHKIQDGELRIPIDPHSAFIMVPHNEDAPRYMDLCY